jgi:hypothetical protein
MSSQKFGSATRGIARDCSKVTKMMNFVLGTLCPVLQVVLNSSITAVKTQPKNDTNFNMRLLAEYVFGIIWDQAFGDQNLD